MTPEQLFDLVEQYASQGIHQTGSPGDHTAAAWMAEQLADAGLTVTVEDEHFERSVSASSLTADGQDVFHLPVPYEWAGSLNTTNVLVESLNPQYGGSPDVLNTPIDAARASGADAVVFATEHAGGSLQAINRQLGAPTSGFPTVLVAGRDLERLQNTDLSLSLDTQLQPGVTHNVVARNAAAQAGDANPLILTTPLSGWFTCAGERGTGIAVLLGMLENLTDRPVVVVATGGHELGWFGSDRWVDATTIEPSAVVHVGASIAVLEPGDGPDRQLATTRFALTSLDEAAAAPIAAALEPARVNLGASATNWVGEGQSFSKLPAPLLSMSGAGLDFHTPEDTPHRATSPAALDIACSALTAAAILLDDAARATA